VRKRKPSSSWINIIGVALSLVIIPMLMGAPGADEDWRNFLTLMWLAMAGYLVWQLAHIRRAPLRKVAGAVSAGPIESSARPDVVEWVLPPAPSSPSRSDAMHRVPDYCARLLMGGSQSYSCARSSEVGHDRPTQRKV
jgi:hypothetical protein